MEFAEVCPAGVVRILIVDDDDVDRERLRRMLASAECRIDVVEAESVEGAVAALQANDFDGIILDYRLGHLNGLDVLEQIRVHARPFCAIVMVTGLGDEHVAAAALRAGVCDYLTKNQLKAAQLQRALIGALRRVQLEQQLHEMAHYDALTRLASRTLLIDRLQQAIVRCGRAEHMAALAFIDLDHFKPVNDTWGHAVGDEVLVEVANRLQHAVRNSDTVARIGGDEFVLLITELHSTEECEQLLQRVRDILMRPIILQGDLEVCVTASIGVTMIHDSGLDADTVLRQADQTMYNVKNAGRNNVLFFDPEAEQQLIANREALEAIRHGLNNREFCLFYQPKIELGSWRLLGFEALIRWRHPERGLLSPDAFLRSLEHEKLGVQIGEWVLQEALHQLHAWQKAEGLSLKVSVNISARHLQCSDFVARLRQFLQAVPDVSAESLELEILETVEAEDIAGVKAIAEECHHLGVTIALDDFGTGYSSLTYLRRLPIDTLKIDKSFVINMLANQDDRAIVSGVIGLCRNFGRHVLAEGVESREHMLALLDMGCPWGQGYGIARPMPAEAVPAWVRQLNLTHADDSDASMENDGIPAVLLLQAAMVTAEIRQSAP